MSARFKWVGSFALSIAIVGLASRGVRAGDRQLELLFINMTPDALADPASDACVSDFEKQVRQGYVHLRRMGETRFRRLVHKPDRSESFLAWTGAQLRPARERGEAWTDTVILVDCRPVEDRLDILVASPDGGTTAIRSRRLPLSPKRLAWLVQELWRHAWAGFNV